MLFTFQASSAKAIHEAVQFMLRLLRLKGTADWLSSIIAPIQDSTNWIRHSPWVSHSHSLQSKFLLTSKLYVSPKIPTYSKRDGSGLGWKAQEHADPNTWIKFGTIHWYQLLKMQGLVCSECKKHPWGTHPISKPQDWTWAGVSFRLTSSWGCDMPYTYIGYSCEINPYASP